MKNLCVVLFCLLAFGPVGWAKGLEPLCTISFAADKKYPARIEDSAAACLARAMQALRPSSDGSLLVVGGADQNLDKVDGNGSERMLEDETGEDLRFWDLASYRAVNTKAYLVRWLAMPATRIIPVTTTSPSQMVAIYLLPAGTAWKTTLPGAVGIFENPCTNKPCPTPEEERLTAQQRGRILKPHAAK